MNFREFYQGWRNKLFPPERLRELIKQTSEDRLVICRGCEHDSKVARSLRIPFSSSWRPDEHCILCQCVLSAKTACLDCSCPIKKWEAVLSEEEADELEKLLNEDSS